MATDTGFGKVKYFDDFIGVAIDVTNDWNGVGTSDTIAVSAQNNGAVRLTTHSDDNDSSRLASMAVFNPSMGAIIMEARVTQVTDAEGRGFFVGWTDDATTEENPISISGTTVTTTASNAVGFYFDTDATTDTIRFGGVKTDTDSTQVDTSVAIADAATWTTFRVMIDVDGNAVGSINGKEVARVANAVTANTDLCATVLVKNSDAAAASMDVDYIYIEGSRE
jgi:hypothetical protein